jgi:hypothetical protein
LKILKSERRLSGRARDALEQTEAPRGIDERPFLFVPACGGEYEMRALRGFGRGIHVLHDEEIELARQFVKPVLIDP